ncbi:Uncharacterised protein [Vibrio cholerae]|nr:Uncharacterised protein [Vibrio cholerae]
MRAPLRYGLALRRLKVLPHVRNGLSLGLGCVAPCRSSLQSSQ